MAWRISGFRPPSPVPETGALVVPGQGPLGAALRAALRSTSLAELRPPAGHTHDRHPLAPAAVRVERSRSRRPGESSDQTAVTMWFGEGPPLPGVGTGSAAWRATVRLGAGVLGAAALAAATTVAARRKEERLSAGPVGSRSRITGASRGPAGD